MILHVGLSSATGHVERGAEGEGWMLVTRPASKGCCVEQEVRDVQGIGHGGKKHTGKVTPEKEREIERERGGDGAERVSWVCGRSKGRFSLLSSVAGGYRTSVNNR